MAVRLVRWRYIYLFYLERFWKTIISIQLMSHVSWLVAIESIGLLSNHLSTTLKIVLTPPSFPSHSILKCWTVFTRRTWSSSRANLCPIQDLCGHTLKVYVMDMRMRTWPPEPRSCLFRWPNGREAKESAVCLSFKRMNLKELTVKFFLREVQSIKRTETSIQERR